MTKAMPLMKSSSLVFGFENAEIKRLRRFGLKSYVCTERGSLIGGGESPSGSGRFEYGSRNATGGCGAGGGDFSQGGVGTSRDTGCAVVSDKSHTGGITNSAWRQRWRQK